MRSFRSISIRQKLLLVSLLTTATALLLASAAFIALGFSLARNALIHKAEALAAGIGTVGSTAIQSRRPEDARRVLEQWTQHAEVEAACLYTLDGEPLVSYHRGQRLFVPPPAEDVAWRFRDQALEIYRLVPPAGTAVGRLYLRYDSQDYYAGLRHYAGVVVGVILVPFGLAWLLSSRLREIISRPILQLAQTSKRVWMEKDYSIRAPKESDDELGALIDAFNGMLERIQERDLHLEKAREELERRVHERTRELQQQVTRISLLNQITRGITQRQDLDSIFHVVLGQLETGMSIDLGCVFLFDAQTGLLSVAAARRRPGTASTTPLDRDAFTIRAEDAGFPPTGEEEFRFARELAPSTNPLFRKFATTGMGSAVAVPLRVEHRLFGLLAVAREQVNGFMPGECEFLRALGAQVGVAGHQAQLHAELRQAYDELRQTQQAVMQQERLRALGQMASGIAHDINNALSPVSGFAELLLLTEPQLSPSGRRHLQHIKTAGEDVAHIVAQLREFYRARKSDQPLSPVRVNQVVQQVIELTRPRWRDISHQRGIHVEVITDLDPGDPEIAGAESEIREALTNLMFNALDAMPNGGAVTLRTRFGVWVSARGGRSSPGHVVLEVMDTGMGMDEETRKHCLEPFFSTKGQRGTGLGLAMVYGVVQRHEGTIEIESELGRGSTLRLIFPAREAGPVSPPEAPTVSDPLPPLRILFVDDEPLVRELVRDILQNDGHRVTLADGGQAGLDAFFAAAWRDQPFDAVITDLGMPYLDGRQLAHILKRESPTTPVIMMTGWGSLMKGEEELRAPVDGLLNKPPRIHELQEALRRVIYRAPAG